MIKVLDLFAGTQSVKKALSKKYKIDKWVLKDGIWSGRIKKKNYMFNMEYYHTVVQYIGIDIYSPEDENMILDLTQDDIVKALFIVLGYWKPNFIWASPTCTTWSIAAISHHWEVVYEGNKIVKRIPKTEAAIRGIKMVENVRKIVDHFNVPFAIENPRGTMRKFPTFMDLCMDTAMYCQYGDTRMKPTDIWSSSPLNLKKCKNGNPCHIAAPRGSSTGTQGLKGNAARSVVPYKLINEILSQLGFK